MAEQKQDGLDLDANGREELAAVLREGAPGTGPMSDENYWLAEADHVLAAGWVSPAAVAERDAELATLRDACARSARLAAARLDRLGAVAALHRPVEVEPSATICGGCSTLRGSGDSLRYFPTVEWPCETAAVLGPVSGAVEGAGDLAAVVEAALRAAWDDGNAMGLDGWIGPERGEEPDEHAIEGRRRFVESALGAVPHLSQMSLRHTPVAGHEQEVRADELRKAVDAIQRIYDMQCPTHRDRYPKGKAGEGSWIAHQWWSVVLGGELERLRNRADRLAARTPGVTP
jgi:hypothetical protein